MAIGLEQIDLKGYGEFGSEAGTFVCEKYHLPRDWDWVFTNGDALLRACHNGAGYFQLSPPGGPALFKLERGQRTPCMFAWLICGQGAARRAFSNFYRPELPPRHPGAEPDKYSCRFSPQAAFYQLEHSGWRVETELCLPPAGAALAMTVTVTNLSRKTESLTIMPVVKPHMAPFSLAPWDVPEIYQTAAYFRDGARDGVWLETRDPSGDPAARLRSVVVTDLRPTRFEVSRNAFAGAGSWDSPLAVWEGRLGRAAGVKWRYGQAREGNAVISQPPVAAFSREVTVRSGKSFTFSFVFGKLPDRADGSLPSLAEMRNVAKLLEEDRRVAAQRAFARRYAAVFSAFRLETPDPALNRYFTEFLSMQLDWVALLDRGWPTGMRGVRDCAQDATGIIPSDSALARTRLEELFSCERSDGWCVRQYSTSGPEGTHDLREYVDSAVWVWECLYEYLCHTRDFGFLDKKLRWLDDKRADSVLEHAMRLFDYYLAPQNLGRHGLCKIREGDWNDSVNRAGLLGRGESVMVSFQVALALGQAAELLLLPRLGGKFSRLAAKLRRAEETLRRNLLRHAKNSQGYFNGVFNDAGKWIFSPRDPDGKARVNGPVNSFAIISGVARGRLRETVLAALGRLKGPHGWRLFYPGIGVPPIPHLGRIGAGDLAVGVGENGTCYNHGAHGFLGRAAWTAGRGDLLLEVLRHMLPYDQQAHPVEVAKAPPYGVLNHWKEAPGMDGEGGDSFLSGSITTAVRNVYQGLIGFRPGLKALTLDPCLPRRWKGIYAEVPFFGGRCRITVVNRSAAGSGVAKCLVNGEDERVAVWSDLLERRVAAIPFDLLRAGGDNEITVELG